MTPLTKFVKVVIMRSSDTLDVDPESPNVPCEFVCKRKALNGDPSQENKDDKTNRSRVISAIRLCPGH